MIQLVTTASGSVYRIDSGKGTWERITETDRSGDIRTSGGPFDKVTGMVVGERMTIFAPGLAFGNRWIHTSVVTEISDAE